MLLAADNGQVTALCLLDLTAAFDTVDHELLMLRLERHFGIHDVALEWFRSYLQGRSFRVIYDYSTSATIHIVCSVPQGSQLYCHCLRDEMSATTVRLERCLAEVSHWMSANRLKLNPDKTELL